MPTAAPATICDILPSAAALLGVTEGEDRLGLVDRCGGARRVLVVLVDGMGHRLLPAMAPHAPILAAVLAGSAGHLEELSCTFPSTTPTSLASFATGTTPGGHGLLGFTLNVPGTDRVLTHIAWRDDPAPSSWQPVPTWFERIARHGVQTAVVLPSMFAGSGLTEAAYRGARFHGVQRGEGYADAVLSELGAGPGLVYAYTASLDTAAHLHGIGSPEWTAAAARVDALLTRLAGALPPDAVMLVTADHGGLNVPADRRIDIGGDPRLAEGLRVVAGEPRMRHLHAVAGAAADVLATWSDLLAGRADVLARDEVVASGAFGPVRPEHLARIGDVVVTCRDDGAVLATDREPPELARLVGFHGAATPVEMAIPLITFAG